MHPNIIEKLDHDKDTNTIKPWIILQTDKVIVVASNDNNKKTAHNSCTIYYFQKNPYKLMAPITLEQTNSKT